MEIAIVFALILCNGLFAMSEIAMVTARRARLQQLAEEGDGAARAALEIARDPTRFLSTIQIGITSIGVMTGIFGEEALARPLAAWLQQFETIAPIATGLSIILVVSGITFVSIVVGELVPKRIGQMHAEAIASRVARPMALLAFIATPFVKALSFSTDRMLRLVGARESNEPPVTEEEIQVLMQQGTTAGVFEAAEQQMVRNVFRLDERKLTSLMVPRADIVYLDITAPPEVNQAKIENAHFSRFPVCRGDLSDVVGFARAKDLLSQAIAGKSLDLTARMAPALYVPETLTGTELVENFQTSRTQAALVVDEYGEVQGLVTLRDVLEAIVGEFHTSADGEDERSALQREDGSWLLDGLIDIHELEDTLALNELPEGEAGTYHTLSGMLMLLLGRIPMTGDRIEWAGWRFEVVDMDGKRIDKVLASRLPPDEESESSSDGD